MRRHCRLLTGEVPGVLRIHCCFTHGRSCRLSDGKELVNTIFYAGTKKSIQLFSNKILSIFHRNKSNIPPLVSLPLLYTWPPLSVPPYPPVVLCKSACVWSCPVPDSYALPDVCLYQPGQHVITRRREPGLISPPAQSINTNDQMSLIA